MVRFGVIGAGRITRTFCDAVNKAPTGGTLYAVASRSKEKAQGYKKEYGFEVAYGSYEAMLKDPKVDCVYIATPHAFHYDQIMRSLDHKKHVLCEKPLTLNAAQAKSAFNKAQENGCFLMEALWTRFLPTILEVKQLVDSGVIGDVRRVKASFAFKADAREEDRLFNKALGGGALLDLGIYPITFANLFLGTPDTMDADVTIYEKTGIDLGEEIVFTYADAQAILYASLGENREVKGMIEGEDGHIEVPGFFYAEKALVYDKDGTLLKTIDRPHEVNGFEYEILETVRCINEGRLESPLMPHRTTVDILNQMDTLRKRWGLAYPQEH